MFIYFFFNSAANLKQVVSVKPADLLKNYKKELQQKKREREAGRNQENVSEENKLSSLPTLGKGLSPGDDIVFYPTKKAKPLSPKSFNELRKKSNAKVR